MTTKAEEAKPNIKAEEDTKKDLIMAVKKELAADSVKVKAVPGKTMLVPPYAVSAKAVTEFPDVTILNSPVNLDKVAKFEKKFEKEFTAELYQIVFYENASTKLEVWKYVNEKDRDRDYDTIMKLLKTD
jgi:hypothetical protein